MTGLPLGSIDLWFSIWCFVGASFCSSLDMLTGQRDDALRHVGRVYIACTSAGLFFLPLAYILS